MDVETVNWQSASRVTVTLVQPQDCATAKLEPNNQVANTSKPMLADLVIQLVKYIFFMVIIYQKLDFGFLLSLIKKTL